MITAHIFDLDGTLIDSMEVWKQIDKGFLFKRGISLPNDYHEYAKVTTPLSPAESAAYAIDFFGLTDTVESILKEVNSMAEGLYRSVPLKPYAIEFLKSLKEKGAKMAVATSSPKNLCMSALKSNGIEDVFDSICLSEEVGFGKYRPDVFLDAAQKLGADPKDCIVYEDSLVAIQTAKKIGMTVCAVYDKASDKDWGETKQAADCFITNWGSLLNSRKVAFTFINKVQ